MRNSIVLKMSLCAGRHEIPAAVDGAIFPAEIPAPLMRYEAGLEEKAAGAIAAAGHKYCAYIMDDSGDGLVRDQFTAVTLDLYVTGLTVALIAVLNCCRKEGIPITLYHYDRETGEYFPQTVA